MASLLGGNSVGTATKNETIAERNARLKAEFKLDETTILFGGVPTKINTLFATKAEADEERSLNRFFSGSRHDGTEKITDTAGFLAFRKKEGADQEAARQAEEGREGATIQLAEQQAGLEVKQVAAEKKAESAKAAIATKKSEEQSARERELRGFRSLLGGGAFLGFPRDGEGLTLGQRQSRLGVLQAEQAEDARLKAAEDARLKAAEDARKAREADQAKAAAPRVAAEKRLRAETLVIAPKASPKQIQEIEAQAIRDARLAQQQGRIPAESQGARRLRETKLQRERDAETEATRKARILREVEAIAPRLSNADKEAVAADMIRQEKLAKQRGEPAKLSAAAEKIESTKLQRERDAETEATRKARILREVEAIAPRLSNADKEAVAADMIRQEKLAKQRGEPARLSEAAKVKLKQEEDDRLAFISLNILGGPSVRGQLRTPSFADGSGGNVGDNRQFPGAVDMFGERASTFAPDPFG